MWKEELEKKILEQKEFLIECENLLNLHGNKYLTRFKNSDKDLNVIDAINLFKCNIKELKRKIIERDTVVTISYKYDYYDKILSSHYEYYDELYCYKKDNIPIHDNEKNKRVFVNYINDSTNTIIQKRLSEIFIDKDLFVDITIDTDIDNVILFKLSSINYLTLRCSNNLSIPIPSLKSLKELYLMGCGMIFSKYKIILPETLEIFRHEIQSPPEDRHGKKVKGKIDISQLEWKNCKNLETIDVENYPYLPELPENLIKLTCNWNSFINDENSGRLKSLPKLPNTLKQLDIDSNNLTKLPPLSSSLKILIADDNKLKELPTLPEGLEELNIENNNIEELPTLPEGLEDFYHYGNQYNLYLDLNDIKKLQKNKIVNTDLIETEIDKRYYMECVLK